MASSVGFYLNSKLKLSHCPDDIACFGTDEGQDVESDEYIRDGSYTSSSVGRSSISSIPWSDDAIKINQVEWERVEGMLSGAEAPPDEEALRNEINDWQTKFPKNLYHNFSCIINPTSSLTSRMDSLALQESDDNYDAVERGSLNRDWTNNQMPSFVSRTPHKTKTSEDDSKNRCHLLKDFALTSGNTDLSEGDIKMLTRRKGASSSSSFTLSSPPTPVIISIANPDVQRLRMPPIFNVLQTTRKFRNLTGGYKNQSFVQLTQVQQSNSVVFDHDQKYNSKLRNGPRSAWNLPLAANRFFNNRNSVVLPAISSRQLASRECSTKHRATNSISSDVGTTNTTPSSTNNATQKSFTSAKHTLLTAGSSSPGSTTKTNTSNSGRSISAAVQYPRTIYNALYLPYSASKVHAFK